ncbi:hypothetical protein HK099_002385 [Clydaea vesicula]|uniref:Alkylglycerone-phosphate synthase n=1 Tax=Clydaea vesicula TaxID=447962 RepID=A0AAD5Y0S6_9FUNG|nr:hypothetical protein HK099_002385 [Clydaea vesicula]
MKRNIWGWGYGNKLVESDFSSTLNLLKEILPPPKFRFKEPTEQEILCTIRNSRFKDLPKNLQHIFTNDKLERAARTFGKSFRDIVRGLSLEFDNPPDYICFPENQNQILEILQWASSTETVVIPFGGGSSVSGGVEPLITSKRVVTMDLTKNFNKVISINEKDMTATIQAGIFGPALSLQLSKQGFTFRHFPQSFEFSTLGGWVVTKSGGHFATNQTHIDRFVVGMKIVTPRGIVSTNLYPSTGAGPNPDSVFFGSEGILGIVTEVTLRIHHPPKYKNSIVVNFNSFEEGIDAVREIAQTNLFPSQCRLVDPLESMSMGLKPETTLLLGFESDSIKGDSVVNELFIAGSSICDKFGGKPQLNKRMEESATDSEIWKKNFIALPYLPHVYSNGPASYYTVTTLASSKDKMLEEWDNLKSKVSEVLLNNDATITHHHSVGKDHKAVFLKEKDKVWIDTLTNLKKFYDNKGILNPGTLIDNLQPSNISKNFGTDFFLAKI